MKIRDIKMVAENVAAEILKQTDTVDIANMIDDVIYSNHPNATDNDKAKIFNEFHQLIERLEK